MNKLTFSLLAGAAGLFVSAAQAGPLTNGAPRIDNGLQSVAVVCDQHGNCREPHDQPAVVIQQGSGSHNAPQGDHNAPVQQHGQPVQQHGQSGVSVQVPGVSVGVGTGESHERR